MATTLERASFANQLGAHINLKFDNPAGIAAGQTLTVTTPPLNGAKAITMFVEKLLPFGSASGMVLSIPVSGVLLLPKGSAVV